MFDDDHEDWKEWRAHLRSVLLYRVICGAIALGVIVMCGMLLRGHPCS